MSTMAVEQLQLVLETVWPREAPLPGFEHTAEGWDRQKIGLDCDEVYPNLFIGDGNTARDKEYLKEMRISHVVNTSEGRRPGMVDVNAHYYRNIGITYLGLPIVDMPSANIQDYFACTSDFINEALHNGGRVLVNCSQGVSRSPTIVAAFLMLKRGMSAQASLRHLRNVRNVWPNIGFLRQLAKLDEQLRQKRCQQCGSATPVAGPSSRCSMPSTSRNPIAPPPPHQRPNILGPVDRWHCMHTYRRRLNPAATTINPLFSSTTRYSSRPQVKPREVTAREQQPNRRTSEVAKMKPATKIRTEPNPATKLELK